MAWDKCMYPVLSGKRLTEYNYQTKCQLVVGIFFKLRWLDGLNTHDQKVHLTIT